MLRRPFAPALLALGAALACSPAGGPPNLLLVTLDTTRADHLGPYGYGRPTTPRLDALARDAVLYTRAVSTSSWTLPAHASLFTGRFPTSHGARYDPKGPLVLADAIQAPRAIRARGLSPGMQTLAGRLAAGGYDTAAVVGGPWLLRSFGLADGFAHYDDAGITEYRGRRAEDVARGARAWLADWSDRDDGRPFFLFLNFYDPHFPYDPPPPHDRAFLPPGVEPDSRRRAQWQALYDGEIRYVDQQLGSVLELLDQRDLYDDTWIVVTSDHGELFGEHEEWGHGGHLYQELVAIPLLVKAPGARGGGREDTGRVQIHQLFALLLEAAGVGQVDGPPLGEGLVLAEVNPMTAGDEDGGWRAIWDGTLKYHHHTLGGHRLHDLERDPREQVNLLATRPEDAARLRARLERELASLPVPGPAGPDVEVDAETRAALERLGYLGSEAAAEESGRPGGEAP